MAPGRRSFEKRAITVGHCVVRRSSLMRPNEQELDGQEWPSYGLRSDCRRFWGRVFKFQNWPGHGVIHESFRWPILKFERPTSLPRDDCKITEEPGYSVPRLLTGIIATFSRWGQTSGLFRRRYRRRKHCLWNLGRCSELLRFRPVSAWRCRERLCWCRCLPAARPNFE